MFYSCVIWVLVWIRVLFWQCLLIRISVRVNNLLVLVLNSISSGQINGVCSSRGIVRLFSSSIRLQLLNRLLCEIWLVSQLIGSCNNVLFIIMVLIMVSVIVCGKFWCNLYIGSRVRIIVLKVVNNIIVQVIVGRFWQKVYKLCLEVLCGLILGVLLWFSSSNELVISRQMLNQKLWLLVVLMKVSSIGLDSWLRVQLVLYSVISWLCYFFIVNWLIQFFLRMNIMVSCMLISRCSNSYIGQFCSSVSRLMEVVLVSRYNCISCGVLMCVVRCLVIIVLSSMFIVGVLVIMLMVKLLQFQFFRCNEISGMVRLRVRLMLMIVEQMVKQFF